MSECKAACVHLGQRLNREQDRSSAWISLAEDMYHTALTSKTHTQGRCADQIITMWEQRKNRLDQEDQ